MFKSIKRFLFAATMIVALSAPSAAFGYWRSASGGGPTGGQPQASIASATAPSPGGFQWSDAGVGAAGVIILLGLGAGATGVVRQRRAHRPVTG